MAAETHRDLLWEVSVTVVNQNRNVSTNFGASFPSSMLHADRQMKWIQQELFLQHFITHQKKKKKSIVKQIKFVSVHATKYRLTIKARLHSFPALALLGGGGCSVADTSSFNPYPTAFPYGNGMVLHFYQQQESSTTKTVHKVINKGLKTYV